MKKEALTSEGLLEQVNMLRDTAAESLANYLVLNDRLGFNPPDKALSFTIQFHIHGLSPEEVTRLAAGYEDRIVKEHWSAESGKLVWMDMRTVHSVAGQRISAETTFFGKF